MKRRGLLIILSSPSGAGKSTLARRLRDWDGDIRFSVSATTRASRPGEVDGKDYIFTDEKEFRRMVAAEEMLEHAHVFGNFYGSPRKPVEHAIEAGADILFDIDWQGAQQLTQAAADDLVKIFILPPDMTQLEERLHNRAQDSADVISKRMSKSEAEISHWAEYDYVIVNDDLDDALGELRTILSAERLKRKRQLWLQPFVKALVDGS